MKLCFCKYENSLKFFIERFEKKKKKKKKDDKDSVRKGD